MIILKCNRFHHFYFFLLLFYLPNPRSPSSRQHIFKNFSRVVSALNIWKVSSFVDIMFPYSLQRQVLSADGEIGEMKWNAKWQQTPLP